MLRKVIKTYMSLFNAMSETYIVLPYQVSLTVTVSVSLIVFSLKTGCKDRNIFVINNTYLKNNSNYFTKSELITKNIVNTGHIYYG